MSARTVTLSPSDVEQLHDGMTVGAFDSTGVIVCVSMRDRPGDGGLRLTVSEADLKVAAEPEGLHCEEDTRATGWCLYVRDIATSEVRRG